MAKAGLDTQVVLRDVDDAIKHYSRESLVAVDIETSGFNHWQDRIMVISLAAPGLPPAVLHVRGEVPIELIRCMETWTMVGHNMTTFDVPFLAQDGYNLFENNGWVDTMIAEQLCIKSNRKDVKKSLAATLKRHLGVTLNKDVDHSGWGAYELTENQVRYSAEDVQFLVPLWEKQKAILHENSLDDAWETESGAFVPTAIMAYRGLPVVIEDVNAAIFKSKADLEIAYYDLTTLFGITNSNFNPRSPKQVKMAFESAFGIGLAKTDDETMHNLEARGGDEGKAAGLVRQCRQLAKVDMYDEDWQRKYVAWDKRIRAKFWQLGTDTGRYSCSEPNLQQWPRHMRNVIGFQETDDRLILSTDYSQIEILISAIYFGEQGLVDAVLGGDVHSYVGRTLFNKQEITKEERSTAKAASFTLLFAGGRPGLIRTATAGGMHMDYDTADQVMFLFYDAFPHVLYGINDVKKRLAWLAENHLGQTIEIPSGPIRYLFGPTLTPSTVINTIVQGTAAVGLKRSLALMHQRGLANYLCSVVHDEVILDVPKDLALDIQQEVEACMIEGMEGVIGVTPRVESKLGPRWS